MPKLHRAAAPFALFALAACAIVHPGAPRAPVSEAPSGTAPAEIAQASTERPAPPRQESPQPAKAPAAGAEERAPQAPISSVGKATPAEPAPPKPAPAEPASPKPAPAAPAKAAPKIAESTPTAPAPREIANGRAPVTTAPATAPAREPPKAAKPPAPTLDLDALEQRLKDTDAIGVMTKLALKNQVDDLVDQFRDYYAGRSRTTLAELRRPFDLLLMKVLSLLQDRDPALASTINQSREALWAILANRTQFEKLS